MAYDKGIAEILRTDVQDLGHIEEKRMFGGLCFMTFTGRPMGGLIDVTDDAIEDDIRRAQLIALALKNVRSLPPRD